jgi:ankyrin repeat protein
MVIVMERMAKEYKEGTLGAPRINSLLDICAKQVSLYNRTSKSKNKLAVNNKTLPKPCIKAIQMYNIFQCRYKSSWDLMLEGECKKGRLTHIIFTLFNINDHNRINDAICYASMYGHLEVVKHLYENNKKNADITVYKNCPIRIASKNGHLGLVKYLHANGADFTEYNNRAICDASKNGHLEVVKYLHENGADITVCSNYPIRIASENGNLELVKYLHTNGANLRDNAENAMVQAIWGNNLDVVKYLHETGEFQHNVVFVAAGCGYLDIVKYFKEVGKSLVDGRNYSLRCAAGNGHLEMVKYLHANGADVKDYTYNYNAVNMASMYGHLDVVKYFYTESGKDIECARTALHKAIEYKKTKIIEYIHTNGVSNVETPPPKLVEIEI